MKGGDEELPSWSDGTQPPGSYHGHWTLGALNEVHRYESQGRSLIGGTDEAKWLVVEGLAAATDRTGVDVIGDKAAILGQ